MIKINVLWLFLNLCIFIDSKYAIFIETLLKNNSDNVLQLNDSSQFLSVQTSIILESNLILINENEFEKMDFFFENLNSSISIMNQSYMSIRNFNFLIKSSGYALNSYENSSLRIDVKFNIFY